VEQEKKRTQTIEPFNREIDEHEMHLKHKEKKKENNKQKCITLSFKQQKRRRKKTHNQDTLALRMRGL
jgi:hypothetical protein